MKEDIKIIEEMIEVYRSCSVDEEGFDMKVDIGFMKKECEALENLITRYKQQKERIRCLELKIANQKDQIKLLRNHRLRKYVMSEYIEKSKVKEKIKELENQRDKVKIFKNIDEYDRCVGKIEALQELLREE